METTAAPPGLVRTPAQIDEAFGNGSLFTRTAYRLELLDEYDSPETRERIRLWLAGEPQGEDVRAYWDAVIRDAHRRGATMTRVHAIPSDGPLNNYLRFEFDFYRGSVEAGEDVRILPAGLANDIDLGVHDYWLFDNDRVLVNYYGGRGTWLRAEIVDDPAFVAACRRRRDAALSRAIPLNAYLARSTAA